MRDMKTDTMGQRGIGCTAGRALRSCSGTSYVEYFVVAAAVAVATMALVGNLDNIRQTIYVPEFNRQMDEIKGPVAVP